MKNCLMIAYHFPPVRVSSGIQRTLKFTTYLLEHGWCSQVLTICPCAYEKVSNDQLREIPKEVVVKRVFAFDTAKHLSFKGRYLGFMALPDRWVSWSLGGVLVGILMIWRHRPKLIWSTYPIATAHLIGYLLHRISGLPWIADFRDSMTEDDYPVNPTQRKVYRWIEQKTMIHCCRAVFTTPGAIRMYAERYPTIPESKFVLIENGYDEDNFLNAQNSLHEQNLSADKKDDLIVLLHSGILYPSERDPSEFFAALAELKRSKTIVPGQLKVVLRASGHDQLHEKLINENDIGDIVFLEPGIDYESALSEMLTVDGLIIFQAANCNHQIPAKLYEYLRARRPILALTDPLGDTANVLKNAKLDHIAALDDKVAIKNEICRFIDAIKNHRAKVASDQIVESHSRKARTKQLAKVFEEISTH